MFYREGMQDVYMISFWFWDFGILSLSRDEVEFDSLGSDSM